MTKRKKNLLRNNFFNLRMELKFKTQKAFAEHLEIERNQYCRYENNIEQPSTEILYKIYLRIKEIKPNIHMEDLVGVDYKDEDEL